MVNLVYILIFYIKKLNLINSYEEIFLGIYEPNYSCHTALYIQDELVKDQKKKPNRDPFKIGGYRGVLFGF